MLLGMADDEDDFVVCIVEGARVAGASVRIVCGIVGRVASVS